MISKKYTIGINILLCIFLIFICKYVMHPYLSTFKEDDIYCIFSMPDHGEYLTSFLANSIVLYIPKLLNIHPQNLVDPYGVLIRCVISVFGCYLMACFVFFNNKNKALMPFFIIYAFYLTFAVFSYEYRILYIYTAFFRFHFPVIMGFIFWIILYKNKNSIYQIHDKIFFWQVIICFLAGYSSEFVCLFSLIPLSIITIFKCIKKDIKIINKNTILSLAFIFGSLLVIAQSYFLMYSSSYLRNPSIPINIFLNEYFNFVIIAHFIPLCGTFILLFILNKIKRMEIRKVIYILSFVVSPYIIMFLLIFCGCYNYDFSHSWLIHGHFHHIFDIVLYTVQFFLIGNIINYSKETEHNKKRTFALFLVILIILFNIGYNYEGFYKYCVDGRTHHKSNEKMKTYITDKMYLYYILKNKPIILDDKFVHDVVGIVHPEVYSPDIKEANVEDSQWFKYIGFIYPNVVDLSKYDKNNKIYFIPEEKAMKEFFKNGGSFEEGEIEKADFNRLYNKNFILNNKDLYDKQ